MNDREKHKELFENNIKDILSSEELTKLYIELYTAFFGKETKCIGCSVKKDYIRLKNIIFKKNIKVESEKYILKNKFKSKILSYKENKRTIRSYGRLINDDFAMKFIKYGDRKSTRLNSSHVAISYAVFCLKKIKKRS